MVSRTVKTKEELKKAKEDDIGQINCPHCGALVGIKSDDFSLLEGVKQKDKLREK